MATTPFVTMQQRRGLKANLPTAAPDGQLLVATDTKELFFGTGTGVEAFASDVNVSRTRFVALTGSNTTGNGSINKPYATISAAMASITDATTTNRYVIRVAPGAYTETNFLIKPNVFLIGDSIQATRITFTTVGLDSTWTSTLDNRGGFQSVGITTTVGTTHNAPYGMTFDFLTKNATQGKFYFEDVLLFGSLYSNGNTNQINQLWFKNTYFYSPITLDGIKSYHSGNTYFSTVKGIGTRAEFFASGFAPKWKVTLDSGSKVTTSDYDGFGIGFASPNTMLMKYAMGESKSNVTDMLHELENQHYGNFFNIYMGAQKALRGYAIDEAQRLNFNKVYYDDYSIYDGSEAVASGGAQLYYSYGARGSETDNNGKVTSPTITGFPTTATTCVLMATPTLGEPDITFQFSRDNGTSWSSISLDTVTNIPAGSSFKIRVNLKAWSWNFGWAILFNSTV